jgi:hypothetical protein
VANPSAFFLLTAFCAQMIPFQHFNGEELDSLFRVAASLRFFKAAGLLTSVPFYSHKNSIAGAASFVFAYS